MEEAKLKAKRRKITLLILPTVKATEELKQPRACNLSPLLTSERNGFAVASSQVLGAGFPEFPRRRDAMFRIWKAPLIAVIALASLFVSAPKASARVAGPRVVIRGGFYGPGWGWYGPAWYGPGWYAWWGPGYYYGPDAGKVKIITRDKDASVYVDGGYVGPVAKAKNLPLQPGNHDVELRDSSGNTFYRESVQVIPGRTTEIRPDHAG
jgi:hypothetical protein